MHLNSFSTHKTKPFSQWLSVFLCCFWLMSSLTTIVHVHEPAVIEEHNCQLCLANENTSTEKPNTLFNLPFISVIDALSEYKSPHSTDIFQIFLGNRDPPYHG